MGFVPVGPSPSESPRARALRLWAGKGVPPPPQPIRDPALPGEPSSARRAWPPTALCLLQQLPARGGAHAGARPRRGGLLPAVRVQVRGAEHHHHQGARPAPPAPAGPAPAAPWPRPARRGPAPPASRFLSEPLSPLTPSHRSCRGNSGKGLETPPPTFPFSPSHLPRVERTAAGFPLCRGHRAPFWEGGGSRPPEPQVWLSFQSSTRAGGLAGRVPDAPFAAPEPRSRGSQGDSAELVGGWERLVPGPCPCSRPACLLPLHPYRGEPGLLAGFLHKLLLVQPAFTGMSVCVVKGLEIIVSGKNPPEFGSTAEPSSSVALVLPEDRWSSWGPLHRGRGQ